MTRRVLVTILLIGGSVHAQAPPKFEVASVKPNVAGGGAQMVRTPGRLTATNTEFSNLLEMAFQTRLIDLSRVPESLRSQRFDISAKAAGKISGDQYWEMLQGVLVRSFQTDTPPRDQGCVKFTPSCCQKGRQAGTKTEPLYRRGVSCELDRDQLLRGEPSTGNDGWPTCPHGTDRPRAIPVCGHVRYRTRPACRAPSISNSRGRRIQVNPARLVENVESRRHPSRSLRPFVLRSDPRAIGAEIGIEEGSD